MHLTLSPFASRRRSQEPTTQDPSHSAAAMSSIMQYNGAAVITMAGKKCVGIASDRRYGLRNQTISCEMQKTFKVNDRTLCGLTGLATDMQTLEQRFVFRSNMYRLREEVRE